MKSVAIAVMLFAMAAAGQSQSAAEQTVDQRLGRRIALLIGNQTYSKLQPIAAVPKELALVQKSLEAAHFAVTLVNNASYEELTKAMNSFIATVKPGDICFVYYSGYAAQDGDDDFLIPTDFDPATASLDGNSTYPLTTLAKYLEQNKAALKMLFIEGARKIAAHIKNGRPGLRIPDISGMGEVLIAIPTASETFVDAPLDQPGRFTTALVQKMDTEVPLTALMSQVQKAVVDQGNGQQPTYQSSVQIPPEFYFHAPIIKPVEVKRESRLQNRTDREFYVLIPAGKFKMGCVPFPAMKCEKEEMPRHDVTISKSFWMGENEVQVDSYQKFVDLDKTKKRKMPPNTPENKNWKDGAIPINNMTWEDAHDYCSWAGGRLPTEAEWEYAARGGKNLVYPFENLDESRDKANFYGKQGNDRYENLAPVKKFDVNSFGLYDMSGNVWELVSDFFSTDSSDAAVTDPKGPATGKHHVQRGGSFDSDPRKYLRISIRKSFDAPNVNVGFRCVMDDTPETMKILRKP